MAKEPSERKNRLVAEFEQKHGESTRRRYQRKIEKDGMQKSFDSNDVIQSGYRQFNVAESTDNPEKLISNKIKQAYVDKLRSVRTQRRGGGHVRGESAFENPDLSTFQGIANYAVKIDDHESQVALREQLRTAVESLDLKHQPVAMLLMQGVGSRKEIGERLGISIPTVSRRVRTIEKLFYEILNVPS